jgi:hypothetical protein
LQDYNLRRDPATAKALVELAEDCVEHLTSSPILLSLPTHFELVGELETLDDVTPGASGALLSLVPRRDEGTPTRVRVIVAYNADKELGRSLARCAEEGIEPTFTNVAQRWCIPPVDILLRTGQSRNVANISSYFPGLERGRIITTSRSPQLFGRRELASTLEHYRTMVDSVAALKTSQLSHKISR